jgi:hypothetical protein
MFGVQFTLKVEMELKVASQAMGRSVRLIREMAVVAQMAHRPLLVLVEKVVQV